MYGDRRPYPVALITLDPVSSALKVKRHVIASMYQDIFNGLYA